MHEDMWNAVRGSSLVIIVEGVCGTDKETWIHITRVYMRENIRTERNSDNCQTSLSFWRSLLFEWLSDTLFYFQRRRVFVVV